LTSVEGRSAGLRFDVSPFCLRRLSPSLNAAGVAQQEILYDELAIAGSQRPATDAAGYRAINRFRSGFDFDNMIERIAVRTMERGWFAGDHDTPPTEILILAATVLPRSFTRNVT
jgi:hypothetical protein